MTSTHNARSVCKVCQQHWSQYTCPRCNLQYCSLDCYKKHGQQCTETFYRENATEHLESVQATETERQHMLTILARIQQDDGSELAIKEHTNSESDDDDGSTLGVSEEILQKLSLGEEHTDLEINEADLSFEELQAFKRAVASGRLNNLLHIWTPWWNLPQAAVVQLSAVGTSKVSVQGVETGDIPHAASSLPRAPGQSLPLLASLTKAAPSALLQWQLLDVLYTYCFIMRLYNGDYHTDPQEAAMTALQVSSTLAATANVISVPSSQPRHRKPEEGAPPAAMPISASQALLECAEKVCSPGVAGCVGRSTAVGLFQDVATMMKHGRSVAVLALHDLQRLFAASQNSLIKSKKVADVDHILPELQQAPSQRKARTVTATKNDIDKAKKQFKAVARKLHFLLSWANELPSSVYQELLQCVVEELKQHSLVLAEPQGIDMPSLDPFVRSTLLNSPPVGQKPVIIKEV